MSSLSSDSDSGNRGYGNTFSINESLAISIESVTGGLGRGIAQGSNYTLTNNRKTTVSADALLLEVSTSN